MECAAVAAAAQYEGDGWCKEVDEIRAKGCSNPALVCTRPRMSLAVHEIDVRFSCNNTIAAAAEEELKELLMIKPAPESASGT
ncbi:unnamed protein product [Sphagnum troendelagicum]